MMSYPSCLPGAMSFPLKPTRINSSHHVLSETCKCRHQEYIFSQMIEFTNSESSLSFPTEYALEVVLYQNIQGFLIPLRAVKGPMKADLLIYVQIVFSILPQCRRIPWMTLCISHFTQLELLQPTFLGVRNPSQRFCIIVILIDLPSVQHRGHINLCSHW